MPRNHKILLACVICAAFLLRTAGLRSGLPSETRRLATFHPDESITYYSLERMDPASLDFYPGDSLYWGTFFVYTQGAVAKAMQLTGLLELGDRRHILDNLGEADKLYMSGRLIAALFSTATVLAIFLAARILAGARAAFFASFFFAFFYINAWMGSIAKPDPVMLFWGTLALYYAFRISREGSLRDYLLAGVFVGLSSVSKYTGVVFALPVALAWAFRSGSFREALRTIPRPIASAAAAALAFLAVNPYLILRSGDVLGYMKAVASKGAWPADPLAGYLEYLVYILPADLGWPMVLFSAAGLFFLAARRSRESLMVVVFAAAYFLKFGAPRGQVMTYVLPLTPFMALAAGALADRIFDRRWGKVLCVLVAAYTLSYSVYMQSFFLRPSGVTRAGDWIAGNIPPGSAIAISKNDTWTPPEIRRYDAPYRLLEGGTPQSALSGAIAALPEAASDAEYLVLSEREFIEAASALEKGDPSAARALERLESGFEEIKRFETPVSRFFMPVRRPAELFQVRFTHGTTLIMRKKKAAEL